MTSAPLPRPARLTAEPLTLSSPASPAETRVLELLALGLGNKAIAAALVISPRTVESHVSNLLAKTGCRSRTQLLLWWLAQGSPGG